MSLPHHVRFRAALWMWARLLPLVAFRRKLRPLLQHTSPPDGSPYRSLASDYITERVKRTCRKPWLMRDRRCLREGLLAYRFLSLAGYAPVLRFGIEKGSLAKGRRLSAHCWVEIEGKAILNPPTAGMVEILLLGRSGEDAIAKRGAA